MFAECRFIDDYPPVFKPVSFVIPAHNEEQYIAKTIDAIKTAIVELDLVAEVIVVNDDSNDATVNIAQEKGAITLDVSLRNIGAVRNAGANAAIHPWLFFVDADTTVPVKTIHQSLIFLSRGRRGWRRTGGHR